MVDTVESEQMELKEELDEYIKKRVDDSNSLAGKQRTRSLMLLAEASELRHSIVRGNCPEGLDSLVDNLRYHKVSHPESFDVEDLETAIDEALPSGTESLDLTRAKTARIVLYLERAGKTEKASRVANLLALPSVERLCGALEDRELKLGCLKRDRPAVTEQISTPAKTSAQDGVELTAEDYRRLSERRTESKVPQIIFDYADSLLDYAKSLSDNFMEKFQKVSEKRRMETSPSFNDSDPVYIGLVNEVDPGFEAEADRYRQVIDDARKLLETFRVSLEGGIGGDREEPLLTALSWLSPGLVDIEVYSPDVPAEMLKNMLSLPYKIRRMKLAVSKGKKKLAEGDLEGAKKLFRGEYNMWLSYLEVSKAYADNIINLSLPENYVPIISGFGTSVSYAKNRSQGMPNTPEEYDGFSRLLDRTVTLSSSYLQLLDRDVVSNTIYGDSSENGPYGAPLLMHILGLCLSGEKEGPESLDSFLDLFQDVNPGLV